MIAWLRYYAMVSGLMLRQPKVTLKPPNSHRVTGIIYRHHMNHTCQVFLPIQQQNGYAMPPRVHGLLAVQHFSQFHLS